MKRWAIKWGPWLTNPRSGGYIDERTISVTRRGAWELFYQVQSPTITDHWHARIRRGRRNREIRAVRVEVKEIQ